MICSSVSEMNSVTALMDSVSSFHEGLDRLNRQPITCEFLMTKATLKESAHKSQSLMNLKPEKSVLWKKHVFFPLFHSNISFYLIAFKYNLRFKFYRRQC